MKGVPDKFSVFTSWHGLVYFTLGVVYLCLSSETITTHHSEEFYRNLKTLKFENPCSLIACKFRHATLIFQGLTALSPNFNYSLNYDKE